jgi:hypothetical protein
VKGVLRKRGNETGTFYFSKVAWCMGLNGERKRVTKAPDPAHLEIQNVPILLLQL